MMPPRQAPKSPGPCVWVGMARALQSAAMATAIWFALFAAWLWHAIALFDPLDVDGLPPRARARLRRRGATP